MARQRGRARSHFGMDPLFSACPLPDLFYSISHFPPQVSAVGGISDFSHRLLSRGVHVDWLIPHNIIIPPLTSIVSPARKLAASDARKTTTLATSAGVPMRPMGIMLT